jgi:predicted glycoside hydrolase/deacetylase ChbG (UPF0249 family)
MKKLIVTADDYGVFPSINIGVIEAVKAGKVNSVAVLTNYKHSVINTRRLLDETAGHNVDIGVHLTITSGSPVTGDKALSMCNGKCFRGYEEFRNKIELKALREELHEQIKVLTDAGIPVKHLTCHHNSLTLFPEHFDIYLEVAAAHKLPMRSVNILPKKKQNSYTFVLNLMLLDDLSHSDRQKMNKFARQILTHFGSSALKVKAPARLHSEHYGPLPFMDILPFRVNKHVEDKKKALDELFNEFLSSADTTMELMLHLAKGDIPRPADESEIDYPGINRKYFDSRIVELKSITEYDLNQYMGRLERKSWGEI